MSTTIDKAFVKQFEREVHESFQRMGSKLRATVRSKSDVRGASTIFQKVGKGVASTKARHGKIPTMNVDHTPVECILTDYYAGDWVDKLDEPETVQTSSENLGLIGTIGTNEVNKK
jgi:hypothetical protein